MARDACRMHVLEMVVLMMGADDACGVKCHKAYRRLLLMRKA